MRYKNPKLVVAGIIKHKGKLLLIRRGINPGKGRWALPGGYVDFGEHPSKAVIREIKEECNIDAKIIDHKPHVYDINIKKGKKHFHAVRMVFLLRANSTRKMKADKKEVTDVRLFSKNEYKSLKRKQLHFRHDEIIKDILKW
jgi:8-oxo-dGTP diphosphatase